jgi:hypothetical protein
MTPAMVMGLGGVALATLAVLALVVATRRARRSRLRLEERLEHSRREVADLAHEVTRLASEVRVSRRVAVDDREYVITTLPEATEAAAGAAARGGAADPGASLAGAVAGSLEEQALTRLSRVDSGTRFGAQVAGAGVKAIALVHGVRRALSQANRDRAYAEAHVARRRSRRARRQELREARRLLRAVRAQQAGRVVHSEDAA